MKAKKIPSQSEFNKKSRNDKIKIVQQLSNRANTRLMEMEKNKRTNNIAYQKAKMDNEDSGRIANRYSRSSHYEDDNLITQAFKKVSSFLQLQFSTLSGVKKQVRNDIDKFIERGDIKKYSIDNLSDKEKVYAVQYMATLSNRRLKALEKAGIKGFAYANAQLFNEEQGREKNRFYRGSKFKDDALYKQFENEQFFLRSKTSTPQGYNSEIVGRLNNFREKGIQIEKDEEEEFLEFLSSKQFESLKQYRDSNQTLKDFQEARHEGVEIGEINDAFNDYKNQDLSDDELQERIKVAKWLR